MTASPLQTQLLQLALSWPANWLAIAVGGTLGCWLRYGQSQLVQNWFGREFPTATMSINIMGSFLMGFLFVATAERIDISPALRLGILTGFLGGYTTFSTFSMETFTLIQGGQFARALLYVGLSVGLGFVGTVAGVWFARTI
jgi:fluoride exporter